MEFDFQLLLSAVAVIGSGVSMVVAVRLARASTAKEDQKIAKENEKLYASKESVREIGRRVDNHGERLADVEAEIKRMPDHNDLADLRDEIRAAVGTMQELKGNFDGVRNTVNMIHEHLLRGGGKEA